MGVYFFLVSLFKINDGDPDQYCGEFKDDSCLCAGFLCREELLCWSDPEWLLYLPSLFHSEMFFHHSEHSRFGGKRHGKFLNESYPNKWRWSGDWNVSWMYLGLLWFLLTFGHLFILRESQKGILWRNRTNTNVSRPHWFG